MLKNQLYKKILSIMLSVSIIFFPVQQAQAFAFLPGVAALAEFMGADAALASSIDASAALHLAVLFIGFNTANSGAPAGAGAALTVRLNPNAPLAVPSGWTAGAGGAQPVPPSSASSNSAYTVSFSSSQIPLCGSSSSVTFSSASNAAIPTVCNWAVAQGYSSGNGSISGTATLVSGLQYHINGTWTASNNNTYTMPEGTLNGSVQCSTGYTVSGSSCVLSNAAVVPKPADGKCTLIGSGSAPVPDSRDPDCAGVAAAFSGNTSTTLADGTKVTHGADGTINITRPDGTWATLNTNSNLETTVIEHYPNASTGMTGNYQTNLSAPNSTTGEVGISGTASGTSQGIGSAAGTSSIGSPNGAGGAGGSGLPTDYNREATQLAIKNSLDTTGAVTDISTANQTTVDKAKDDMAYTKYHLNNIATMPDPVALDNNFFASPFPNSAGCSPWSMTWSDALTGSHTLTLDLCPQQDVIQRISGWVLYILTIATIFSMFFAA